MADFEIQEVGDDVFVTVANVPMIAAGVEFATSSGPFTPTPEDLEEFVASQDDPAIKSPRLFIGHPDDKRFRPPSGEPALGIFKEIRLDTSSLTVYGDIVGVPRWLAEIMPTAYPSRSGEWYRDYETHTGNTWRLVCDPGVALLGVVWPGIHNLDDLPVVFSAQGPDGVEIRDPQEAEVVALSAVPIQAQAAVEDVRRAFYDDFAQGDQFWWWIRAMYLEPNELIVDDDDGQLYRMSFSVTGETVTFGDPEPVKIEYVPDTASTEAAAIAAMASVADGRQMTAVYASRDESRPNTSKEERVSNWDKLKSKLRLASDASEEDVLAAIPDPPEDNDNPEPASPPVPQGQPTGKPEGATDSENTTTEDDEPATPAVETAKVPEGMVLVDKATLESVMTNAAAGAEVAAQVATARRKEIVEKAIQTGKIAPARRDHYLSAMDADEEGTTAVLAAMPDDIVPVTERGTSESTSASSGGDFNALFPHKLGKKEA